MLTNRFLPVFALGITLVLMSWGGRQAQAATINVPGDFATIQGAIDDPNTVAGDEIVVAPGTYLENIDFLGKAITLRSTDPNSPAVVAATIIDGGAAGSVVTCNSSETAATVLDGFTITNGSAVLGGGMNCSGASPTVTNCTFSDNTATSFGGGMLTLGSSPTMTNCTFIGNMANISGGGMFITNSSSLTMANCTFSGNMSIPSGGGMYINNTSHPMVTNCTFSQNMANTSGGGIYNTNGSNPTMTNCIIWGNSDFDGMDESGQIHTAGGVPVVNYSDVQGTWNGSGSNNIDTDPLFIDPNGVDDLIGTVDDNLRLQFGSPCIDAGDNGVVSESTDLDGNPRISHVTVDMGAYEVQDDDGDGVIDGLDICPGFDDSVDSDGDSVPDGCDVCLGDDATGDSDGDGVCDDIDICPGFDDTVDSDGDGVPDGCDVCLGDDATGDSDGDGVCDDIDGCPGFDDFVAVHNVTQDTYFRRIQEAINAAVANDVIEAAPCIYYERINFLGKAITVRSASGDPNDTIIDGGGAGSVVRCVSGETATTVLDGFTITNGLAIAGGGMLNNFSSPTVTNCTFNGNSATDQGGGMYNGFGDPSVSNCTFSGNSADNGGGMFNANGIDGGAAVTNCTFSGNSATTAFGGGGGMVNQSGSPTVTNCTFSGNSTNLDGGGMRNEFGSNPLIINCIFWGNSDTGGMDESAQIHNHDQSGVNTPIVIYSVVQGGWTGVGGNNIFVNPSFADADGADNIVGTKDDDLRLSAGSPCIDAGNSIFVPLLFPTDLDGHARIFDDPAKIDTGVGFGEVVDMGAYEFGSSVPPCTLEGDLNCDGIVNMLDLVLLGLNWLETI